MAKRKKTKNRIILFLCLIFLLSIGIYFITNHYENLNLPEKINEKQKPIEEDKKKTEQAEAYQNCINKPFVENEFPQNVADMMAETTYFITSNAYQASVYYEDLNTGFYFAYKPDQVYYGCSLIKLVDALYLINKAIAGEINLDTETLVYTANYKAEFSSGMATRKIGEEVSLRDLITYAISVSDNSAHLMLMDYIGFDTLKMYGQSLGAKVILTGGDKYGNQTARDTNIYLKEAYHIITINEEYGSFLKSIMDNDERNAFNTEDVRIYHKYGSFANNYHDIGLSLEKYPYAISILTLHENNNYPKVVQGIHAKIRETHNAFHTYREESCHQEVYTN